MPYIYKITNIINNKVYIGKTITSVAERFSKHKYDAINKIDNSYIHNAMRKYGLENFVVQTLEECSELELSEKERFWINFYQSYDNPKKGYNLTPGGEGNPKYEKALIQELWFKGYNQTEISNMVGCHRKTVLKYLLEISSKEERTSKKCGNASKAILMIDKNTDEIIQEFESIVKATNFLSKPQKAGSAISSVCKGNRKTAYGFKWKYKNEYFKENN